SRVVQTESEMRDAARLSGVGRVRALEDDHVARARCLHLDEAVLPVYLDRAEYLTVEPRGAIDVAHRKRNVCEAVRANHSRAVSIILCREWNGFQPAASPRCS